MSVAESGVSVTIAVAPDGITSTVTVADADDVPEGDTLMVAVAGTVEGWSEAIMGATIFFSPDGLDAMVFSSTSYS